MMINNKHDPGIGLILIILFIGTFLCYLWLSGSKEEPEIPRYRTVTRPQSAIDMVHHRYDGMYDVNYPTYHYQDIDITTRIGTHKARMLMQDTSDEQYRYYQSIGQ